MGYHFSCGFARKCRQSAAKYEYDTRSLCAAPIEVESERLFLSTLCADLKARGQDALVLANFLLPPHNPFNQIDFLVILKRLACHIELKNLTAPVSGEVNGMWHLLLPDGTKKPLHANPYRQALNCKYAISDQMHRLAKRQASLVEPPNGTKFLRILKASSASTQTSQVDPRFRVTN